MWAPLPPAPPERGWWTELPTELDYWVEGVRDGLRAERIERCRQLAHEVDMRAGGALSRDRWARSERRHDMRDAHDHHGYDSWGAGHGRACGIGGRGGEVEHRAGGRILGVW
jgi:hypothetical protein